MSIIEYYIMHVTHTSLFSLTGLYTLHSSIFMEAGAGYTADSCGCGDAGAGYTGGSCGCDGAGAGYTNGSCGCRLHRNEPRVPRMNSSLAQCRWHFRYCLYPKNSTPSVITAAITISTILVFDT